MLRNSKSFKILKYISKNFALKSLPPKFRSSNEKLQDIATRTGAAINQTQNYEKFIFEQKKNDFGNIESDLSSDLNNLIDMAEYNNNLLNDESGQKIKEKIDEIEYEEYLNKSNDLIISIKKGLIELEENDRNIKLEYNNKDKYNLSIKVNVKDIGTYIFVKELETKLFTLTSPISGLFKYYYDQQSKYWRSIKDNHIFDDILIREFCLHSKGILQLNY